MFSCIAHQCTMQVERAGLVGAGEAAIQNSGLPGWAVSSPGSGEQVLVNGVRALLAGLKVTENPVDLRHAPP
jgi:hypothetical protein